jgi:hypothetical protein
MIEDIAELIASALQNGAVEFTIRVRLLNGSGTGKKHLAECKTCGWSKIYTTQGSAARGLRSHQQHCKAKGQETIDLSWVTVMQSTGEGDE